MADRYERDDDGNITGKVITADPGTGPEEAVSVTGRPQDTPTENTTFADRAKARRSSENKAVQSSENKAIGDMTKDELLAEADRRGVDVKRSATKAEIADALS